MIETNDVLKDIFEGEIFNGKGGLDKELKRIELEHDTSVEDFGLNGLGLEGMSLKDLGLNTPGFDDLEQMSAFTSPGLDDATSELLNDPDLPVEIKQLVSGMMEAVEVVNYMGGLIDQSIEAFEQIADKSNDKKITAIAKKMIKVLDDDL